MYMFKCLIEIIYSACMQEPVVSRGHWGPEELQGVVICLMWVLRSKHCIICQSCSTLSHRASFLAPRHDF